MFPGSDEGGERERERKGRQNTAMSVFVSA